MINSFQIRWNRNIANNNEKIQDGTEYVSFARFHASCVSSGASSVVWDELVRVFNMPKWNPFPSVDVAQSLSYHAWALNIPSMLRAHRPSHLSSIAAGQVIALIGRGHRACHARASPGVIPIKHRRLSGDCLDWPRRGRALVQIFLAASLDYCSLFAPVHIWNKIFVVST